MTRLSLAATVLVVSIQLVAAGQSDPAEAAKSTPSKAKAADNQTVAAEHSDIGLGKETAASHTMHPDAQWYPQDGLGLFIHWGICSIKAMNISWPMIPGRALANRKVSAEERERIIREDDYNLNGRPNSITPNQYWEMAKDFNPGNYDPDKWMKAAKAAGFAYAVLTTRHHEGFALWPSKYGNFDTKNYMGGRDLLKPYVEACRRNGIKVGFYYSPPNWYFEKDFKDFMYGRGHQMNPEFPPLGPDLKPRTNHHTPEEIAAHKAAYEEMVRGQVEELLTRYGKIDLLWFDGRAPSPNGRDCISIERIRELQPGIVINPRMHGHGDFITYERKLTTDKVADGWAEFCNTWTTSWSHQNIPFRANGYVLGQYVKCRSLGVNYLLGVGPMATGEFCDDIYQNMAVVSEWMKQNGAAVKGAKPLPSSESASVPATASGNARYLFAVPQFDGGEYQQNLLPPADETFTLKGIDKPAGVKLLSTGKELKHAWTNKMLTVQFPASSRTKLVDVVQVSLAAER
ncbi:MAG TPA: alpha-L-fucosidase [Candidatus Binatia bacterium]|nr:alpha-L-fucosidase [Candidatus Binatia bacterium]